MASEEKAEKPEETEKPEEANLLPVVLIAIVLLFVIFLWFSISERKPEVKPPEIQVVNITGLQITRDSSNYLINIKKGGYFELQKCIGEDCTSINDTKFYPQGIAWSLLGYIGAYKITQDPIYLKLINDGMKELMSLCEKRVEKCLPDASISETCDFVIVQVSKAYELTREPSYLDFMKSLGMCQNIAEWYGITPMFEAIESREKAILYRLCLRDSNFKELTERERRYNFTYSCSEFLQYSIKKLNRAEEYHNNSYILYGESDVKLRQASGWIQLAKLDLYAATGDKTYLNDVKTFYNKIKLSEHLTTDTDTYYAASDLLTNLEALLMITELTNDTSYDDDILTIDNYLVNNYFDDSKRKLYIGRGAILSIPKKLETSESIMAVSDNSHFIYLLSKQDNITMSMELS